eukprot:1503177-Amphidinium_carterae.1
MTTKAGFQRGLRRLDRSEALSRRHAGCASTPQQARCHVLFKLRDSRTSFYTRLFAAALVLKSYEHPDPLEAPKTQKNKNGQKIGKK